MMRGLTSMNEVNGVYVCLSVYRSSDVCMCLHNAWTCNVYVCPLVYTHAMALFSCGCF